MSKRLSTTTRVLSRQTFGRSRRAISHDFRLNSAGTMFWKIGGNAISGFEPGGWNLAWNISSPIISLAGSQLDHLGLEGNRIIRMIDCNRQRCGQFFLPSFLLPRSTRFSNFVADRSVRRSTKKETGFAADNRRLSDASRQVYFCTDLLFEFRPKEF